MNGIRLRLKKILVIGFVLAFTSACVPGIYGYGPGINVGVSPRPYAPWGQSSIGRYGYGGYRSNYGGYGLGFNYRPAPIIVMPPHYRNHHHGFSHHGWGSRHHGFGSGHRNGRR